jgi:hypothetical protein
MASEVTVRKLTQGFMVSTPRTMRDGVPVEEAFAESTRPAMIQRVLRCLGIEPHEAYFEANKPADPFLNPVYPTREPYAGPLSRDPEQDDDTGEPFPVPGCATGVCGMDD